MSNNPEPFYNVEYENARQWTELINSEFFKLLTDKIENSKLALKKDIDKLVANPSLDNSIQAAALGKAQQELNKLLLFFDFMKQHKVQLDQRLIVQKTQPAQIK